MVTTAITRKTAEQTQSVTVRLPVSIVEKLDEMHGSRSDAIRELLLSHVEGPFVHGSLKDPPRSGSARVTNVSGSPRDHATCRISRPGGRPWCQDHQLWVR